MRGLGCELVGTAPTADEALGRFREEQPDVVLPDINLAGQRDGIELAHELVRLRPVPMIFLTAYPDQETFERARKVGPFAFMGKPYNGALLGRVYREEVLARLATLRQGGIQRGTVVRACGGSGRIGQDLILWRSCPAAFVRIILSLPAMKRSVNLPLTLLIE